MLPALRMVRVGAPRLGGCHEHGDVREPALPAKRQSDSPGLPEVQELEDRPGILPVRRGQGRWQADRLQEGAPQCHHGGGAAEVPAPGLDKLRVHSRH